jgi:hypothetical protein
MNQAGLKFIKCPFNGNNHPIDKQADRERAGARALLLIWKTPLDLESSEAP